MIEPKDPQEPEAMFLTRSSTTVALLFALGLPAAVQAQSPPLPASPCATAIAGDTCATLTGYLRMRDGVKLKYSVILPSTPGRHPAVLNFAGYQGGTFPDGSTGFDASTFTGHGYAMVGVNARGTGCSGGNPSTLLQKVWANDIYEVIEWIAKQPWATGKVAMIGGSFPGVTQWTAARRPSPHLAALVPLSTLADPYRDIAMPGGIPEMGFFAVWAGLQGEGATEGEAPAIAQGDTQCAANVASRGGIEPSEQVNAHQLEHPNYDSFWNGQDATTDAHRVKIPTLAGQAWQDDAVGSRVVSELASMVNPKNLWFFGINGGHDAPISDAFQPLMLKFLDHYLKGKPNGWTETPHTTLMFDTRHSDGVAGAATGGWRVTNPSFPPPTDTVTLNLHPNGVLDQAPDRGSKGSVSYDYPHPSASTYGLYATGVDNRASWQVPPPPGGQVAFTTPPLAQDAILYGPSSANLWLTSTASDTDVQVTLTEVRPDGQEQYLTRGWLRASHRALDRHRSTALQPYHPDTTASLKPLIPGKPTLLRVDIRPVSHAIRKGSSLRLIVDAPTGTTGTWAFKYLTSSATNQILTTAAHPSTLTLAVLRHGTVRAPLPDCNTGFVAAEVCRTNTIGVPDGSLELGTHPRPLRAAPAAAPKARAASKMAATTSSTRRAALPAARSTTWRLLGHPFSTKNTTDGLASVAVLSLLGLLPLLIRRGRSDKQARHRELRPTNADRTCGRAGCMFERISTSRCTVQRQTQVRSNQAARVGHR